MVLLTTECKLCKKSFREYKYAMFGLLRKHVETEHKDLFKEIKDLEYEDMAVKEKIEKACKKCNDIFQISGRWY
jgi:hypothetical protein